AEDGIRGRNVTGVQTCALPISVALAQFLVSLDLSVMNVGLPSIQAALGFEAGSLSWVIHAYALTFGGLLLLGGRLADRYGRRRRSEERRVGGGGGGGGRRGVGS